MLNYLNDRTGLMADDVIALRVLTALQDVEHYVRLVRTL